MLPKRVRQQARTCPNVPAPTTSEISYWWNVRFIQSSGLLRFCLRDRRHCSRSASSPSNSALVLRTLLLRVLLLPLAFPFTLPEELRPSDDRDPNESLSSAVLFMAFTMKRWVCCQATSTLPDRKDVDVGPLFAVCLSQGDGSVHISAPCSHMPLLYNNI